MISFCRQFEIERALQIFVWVGYFQNKIQKYVKNKKIPRADAWFSSCGSPESRVLKLDAASAS